jgi:hypothetical protein
MPFLRNGARCNRQRYKRFVPALGRLFITTRGPEIRPTIVAGANDLYLSIAVRRSTIFTRSRGFCRFAIRSVLNFPESNPGNSPRVYSKSLRALLYAVLLSWIYHVYRRFATCAPGLVCAGLRIASPSLITNWNLGGSGNEHFSQRVTENEHYQ